MSVFDSIDSVFGAYFANGSTVNPQYQPLQPKREWVGLTDEEVVRLKLDGRDLEFVSMTALRRFARAIEAKLKEKNT